jgi:hypothetical protein
MVVLILISLVSKTGNVVKVDGRNDSQKSGGKLTVSSGRKFPGYGLPTG